MSIHDFAVGDTVTTSWAYDEVVGDLNVGRLLTVLKVDPYNYYPIHTDTGGEDLTKHGIEVFLFRPDELVKVEV